MNTQQSPFKRYCAARALDVRFVNIEKRHVVQTIHGYRTKIVFV